MFFHKNDSFNLIRYHETIFPKRGDIVVYTEKGRIIFGCIKNVLVGTQKCDVLELPVAWYPYAESGNRKIFLNSVPSKRRENQATKGQKETKKTIEKYNKVLRKVMYFHLE